VSAVAGLVALAAVVPAPAETHAVGIPGKLFSPPRVSVVVGDTVSWRSADVVEHDVRAADGSFGSGPFGRFGGFSHRFDHAGAHPYLCSIHPFMRGQVDVYGALLRAPHGPVLAAEAVRLEGRASAAAAVSLERQLDGEAWDRQATATAGADGAFAFTVAAVEGALYRVQTVAGASPPVAPSVTSGVSARLAVHAHGARARVVVRASPAQPGLWAALQRYSRERYMWRRIAHARLDRRGRARFSVRTARGGRVRVLLSRRPRGPQLAVTDALRVRDGAPARAPQAPHDEHGHP
jgi:plastocyanin